MPIAGKSLITPVTPEKGDDFKRPAALATIVLAFSLAIVRAADARPPTVLNSPGYDARLAESRKAWQAYEASRTRNGPYLQVVPSGEPLKARKKNTRHRR
jgi:hypothetical protein